MPSHEYLCSNFISAGIALMNSDVQRFTKTVPILVLFLLMHALTPNVSATEKKAGFGIQAGMNKLEGDWREPKLVPSGGISISFNPNPFFTIRAVGQFSRLKTRTDANRINPAFSNNADFHVLAVPADLEIGVNFLPYSAVNPFLFLGGGVLYWDVNYEGASVSADGKKGTFSPLAKTGGGLEFNLSESISFVAGADFRYVWTDKLDQIKSGDEKDGIISMWSGFNFYFGGASVRDADRDHIPDELDLAPEIAENLNGYLDHDGRPEASLLKSKKLKSPTVIHHPFFKAMAGRDITFEAKIVSDEPIRPPALLYRLKGARNWKVQQLEKGENETYTTQLKKGTVKTDFEYCIVAVTKSVSGVGYAGTPKRPLQVRLLSENKTWKTAGGILTAAACGSASYLILRKQKN